MPPPDEAAEGSIAWIEALIRDVPDFPRAGILFKDITPLLGSGAVFGELIALIVDRWRGKGVTRVAAIESRGFIIGAPVAERLGVGLVPLRKPGKLPYEKVREEYALEYGIDALEGHVDGVGGTDRVLLVDDVLATGGTAAAAIALLGRLGAAVVGASFVIELAFLGGSARLGGLDTQILLRYA